MLFTSFSMSFRNLSAVLAGALFLAVGVPSQSAAAEIKPCKTCALQRLITSANLSDTISFINYDSQPAELNLDYVVLEKLMPQSMQRGLEGLSGDDAAEIVRASSVAVQTEKAAGRIVATYDLAGKKVEITNSDLETLMNDSPFYLGNTSAVAFASREEKLRHLNSIIKTNLLLEEGLSNFKKYEKQILNEKEYMKTAILKEAAQKLAEEAAANGNSQPPAGDALNSKILRSIDFAAETQNIELLRNVADFSKYTGEVKIKLASYKGGKLLLEDILPLLANNPEVWAQFKSFDAKTYLSGFIANIIASESYAKYLSADKDALDKLKIKPYSEYFTYQIAELVIQDFQNSINVSKKECEDHYNANPEKYLFAEGLKFSYFIFDSSEVKFFEKLSSNKNIKSTKDILAAMVAEDVNCEVYPDQATYRGILQTGLDSFLFSMKLKSFSGILKINKNGGRHVVFYADEKIEPKTATFAEAYPLIYRRMMEERKTLKTDAYFSELFKKYNVKISL